MKRLKDNHPTMKKFNELCEKAHSLGLYLTFNSYGNATLCDDDQPGIEFHIQDLDQPGNPFEDFPPEFDFKIMRE